MFENSAAQLIISALKKNVHCANLFPGVLYLPGWGGFVCVCVVRWMFGRDAMAGLKVLFWPWKELWKERLSLMVESFFSRTLLSLGAELRQFLIRRATEFP